MYKFYIIKYAQLPSIGIIHLLSNLLACFGGITDAQEFSCLISIDAECLDNDNEICVQYL